MSVSLIVTRSIDRNFNSTQNAISLEEWLAFVSADSSLRLVDTPWVVINPRTKQKIPIPLFPGQTEFLSKGKEIPFLCHERGELHMRYRDEFENPDDVTRKKIVEIARQFDAIITHDAGDEILEW